MKSEPLDEIGILIAALQKSRTRNGWIIVRSIAEVPAETGDWALYDGLDVVAGGVAWNTKKAIQASRWFGKCEQPIYAFAPDKDGSGAHYLREAGFHE